MVVLARACRKPSREVMIASCLGCVFHVLIALGKKEYCMVIVLVCGLSNLTLCPLVIAPVGMRNCSGGISTKLYTILNSKIVLIRVLMSLSSSQPSCDIMLVTLLVCR